MPSPHPPEVAAGRPAVARPLRATYRLQFHAGFGLAEAEALLPYLDQLGVSHLYASPLLQARAGSLHGYDLTDPRHLNPELGSEAELERLSRGLRERGMSLLLDIVPNHMAATRENPWWWEVLESGRAAPEANWFDIDWRARGSRPEAAGRIVLPVLGARLAQVLARGELSAEISSDGTRGVLRYFQRRFPLNRASLARRAAAPPETRDSPAALRRLLGGQHYLLVHWRAANQEINYRRFFAINELVGFRVEEPAAFAASHQRIGEWLRRDVIQAVRVDHVDGLWDPAEYLERLRALFPGEAGIWVEKISADDEALPPDWPVAGTTGYDFLAALDRLQVEPQGYRRLLVGYHRFVRRRLDFAAVVYGKKRQAIRAFFQGEMRGLGRGVAALAQAAGVTAIQPLPDALATRALNAIAANFPVYRTYARELELSEAGRAAVRQAVEGARRRAPRVPAAALIWVGQLLAADPAAGVPAERHPDWLRLLRRWQQYTAPIMAKGKEDSALYVYIPLASLDEVGGDPGRPVLSAAEFHQFLADRRRRQPRSLNASSTHDTKRGEDVRARLDALSEIPAEWARATQDWERMNRGLRTAVRRHPAPIANAEYLIYQTLAGAWPPDDGGDGAGGGGGAPPPELAQRLRDYMRKAVREAAVETDWQNPDGDYEAALDQFLESILDPARSGPFLASLRAFVRRLGPAGALNSLAQLTLKVFAPGVADFYQGCEMWNFSLVDPDNRRAVDFARRRECLEQWARQAPDPLALLRSWPSGEIKLWLTQRLLRIRRERPELCLEGDYVPVAASGREAARVFAFLRRHGGESLVVAVPLRVGTRLTAAPSLEGFDWGDTQLMLPEGEWQDLLLPAGADGARRLHGGEGKLSLAELMPCFPAAVLLASGQ